MPDGRQDRSHDPGAVPQKRERKLNRKNTAVGVAPQAEADLSAEALAKAEPTPRVSRSNIGRNKDGTAGGLFLMPLVP